MVCNDSIAETTKLFDQDSNSSSSEEDEKLKSITWEELQQHSNPENSNGLWVVFRGKVYDVTKWKELHPGGSSLILNAAGRDITNLFDSYHKLASDRLFGSLKVPLVGYMATEQHEFPQYVKPSQFYTVMRKRVEQYFRDQNIKDVRELTLFNKLNTVFIFTAIILCYYASMYSSSLSFGICCLFSILAGLFHHLSLVHVFHDLSHGSYSKNSKVWFYLGGVGDFLVGHSFTVWITRHVFGHHIYTNVAGIDCDLAFYKAYKHEELKPYRQKPLLIPPFFLYFMHLVGILLWKGDEFISYYTRSMENVRIAHQNKYQVFHFWSSKFLFYFHRILLPIMLGCRSITDALILYTLTEVTVGVFFGWLSQISHVDESREYPKEYLIKKDWAELQVLTSIDYCHDSYFWTYLSGYLNYQTVHHLFPSVAPHFYPQIVSIVKKTCNEFNVPYQHHNTFGGVIYHYLNYLTSLFNDNTTEHFYSYAHDKGDFTLNPVHYVTLIAEKFRKVKSQ